MSAPTVHTRSAPPTTATRRPTGRAVASSACTGPTSLRWSPAIRRTGAFACITATSSASSDSCRSAPRSGFSSGARPGSEPAEIGRATANGHPRAPPPLVRRRVPRAAAFWRFYNRYVSAGGPELFVVCKSCGSEVSSYITECPYCGNRLRKRAPKLDRDGRVAEKRARRTPPPLLTRLRRDEIPGIRPDTRPYATFVLVLAGMVGTLLWRTGLGASNQLEILGKPGTHWWRLFTAVFTYNNIGYAFVTLFAIALFGWLLERRHGPITVIGLFLARRRRRDRRDRGGLSGPGRDGRQTAPRWRCCAHGRRPICSRCAPARRSRPT